MSCQNRDPLEKQDTSSESGESYSDSGVNETEENLEHLESAEPKSTSSDEPRRKEAPETESSSESSITEPGRKSWQRPGLLGSPSPTISSEDSVMSDEDEDKASPSSPELRETEGECKEKFETTPEEDNECAAASTEVSESQPSAFNYLAFYKAYAEDFMLRFQIAVLEEKLKEKK